MPQPLDIVILGLSITSSWGNGHATCYRGLVKALSQLGHRVLFLERDVTWYAENRDLAKPPFGRTRLYANLEELHAEYAEVVRDADLVIVGSYVPEGVEVGRWVTETARGVTGFYDIDTPVTLERLERNDCSYLTRDLVSEYDLYLSFTAGPTLRRLQREFGARRARALFCSVDPDLYYPEPGARLRYDLGYMGTYSADRQTALKRYLIEPAKRWSGGRFAVVGPQYPKSIHWPENVHRIEHLSPREHRRFYNAQRYTLNVTRAEMVLAGHSPSVRLFEAAACGTPIISDFWSGLDELFVPGREVLIARSTNDVLRYFADFSEKERLALGERARQRVLAEHTAIHRAEELVRYAREVRPKMPLRRRATPWPTAPLVARRSLETAALGTAPHPGARGLNND